MFVTLVISQFGFDDRILVLIVQVQGRSLLIPYFLRTALHYYSYRMTKDLSYQDVKSP